MNEQFNNIVSNLKDKNKNTEDRLSVLKDNLHLVKSMDAVQNAIVHSIRILMTAILEETLNAILAGKLALMVPVMIFTEGRCVAMIRWIPTARANCASLAIGISISLPAVMIRSANSSMTSTMNGRY